MLEKISAFWRVLKLGEQVADPVKWRKHQVKGNQIGILILALVAAAKACGYQFPISEDDALVIGGAIVAIANIVLTMATHEQIGLPSKPQAPAESTAAPEQPKNPDDTYFG